MVQLQTAAKWSPFLKDIDAVVNCAGVLQDGMGMMSPKCSLELYARWSMLAKILISSALFRFLLRAFPYHQTLSFTAAKRKPTT